MPCLYKAKDRLSFSESRSYNQISPPVSPNLSMVIANIIADVVISLAGQIGTVLRPEGTFICSGIIREREQDVLDALERDGYEVCEVRRRGEWVAICSKRVG